MTYTIGRAQKGASGPIKKSPSAEEALAFVEDMMRVGAVSESAIRIIDPAGLEIDRRELERLARREQFEQGRAG